MTRSLITDPSPDDRRDHLWLLRVAVLLQFITVGALFAFEAVWMRSRGIGETMIGTIAAAYLALTFIGGLVWGYLADATGRPLRIVIIGCCFFSAAMILFVAARTVEGFLLYSLLRGLGQPMVMGMMPLLVMAVASAGSTGRNYGNYRMFGSMGFILGTLVLGVIFGNITIVLIVAAAGMLIAIAPLSRYRVRTPKRQRHGDSMKILRNGELMGFYVATFFFACANPAIFTFMPAYAQQLGADERFIGFLASCLGFVALVALPVNGWLTDRFGPRWLLWLAFTAQPVRALSLSFIASYPLLTLPQLLHFFTWAGSEVAAMIFVTRLAGAENRGTAISIYTGMFFLGMMVGAPLCGYLAEHHGYPVMYRWAAGFAVVGWLIFQGVMLHLAPARQRAVTGKAGIMVSEGSNPPT